MPTIDPARTVFRELKAILSPYAKTMTVVHDRPDSFYLDAGYSEKWKKSVFFACTAIKKSYVSFYLMPVYVDPSLLDDVSPALKRRMQGKSCFNFTEPDAKLFRELAALTKKGFNRFRKEKFVRE